jgi:tryptophan synthase alpha chain
MRSRSSGNSAAGNRLEGKFSGLKSSGRCAFIAFLTAGYPSLKETERLVLELDRRGVDIIELGVPFSDPMADGPAIQFSSQQALKKGVNLKEIMQMVRGLRSRTDIPICLMTYFNPVFCFGEERFAREAARCGIDGVIIPDLPPEEASLLTAACAESGVSNIFFVSPTTTAARVKKVAAASTGFIYYLSLTGVTGARAALPPDAGKQMRVIRRFSDKPVCMGFGISTPEQVRQVCKLADGAIVGSAIVSRIRDCIDKGSVNILEEVGGFGSRLKEAAKG